MDPVDPKRRGRRLFGGRRRHEHAAEDQMNEPTTTVPDAAAAGTLAEREPAVAGDPEVADCAAPSTAVGVLGEDGSAPEPAVDEPVVLDAEDGIAVIPDEEPETGGPVSDSAPPPDASVDV